MKLKVLGSLAPYPKDDKNVIGFLIKDGMEKVLLDCGTGITRNLNFPEDLKNLTIIISHLHRDHYADLLPISYAAYVHNAIGNINEKIKVYIPKDIKRIDFDYIKGLTKSGFYEFIEYDENTILNIGNMKIYFYKTIHTEKSYAIKIENEKAIIAYSSDTAYENAYLSDFIKNADMFICESTFLKDEDKRKTKHLNAVEAASLAKVSMVKKLMLTHFWPETEKSKYLEEAKCIFENTIVSNENEEFDF